MLGKWFTGLCVAVLVASAMEAVAAPGGIPGGRRPGFGHPEGFKSTAKPPATNTEARKVFDAEFLKARSHWSRLAGESEMYRSVFGEANAFKDLNSKLTTVDAEISKALEDGNLVRYSALLKERDQIFTQLLVDFQASTGRKDEIVFINEPGSKDVDAKRWVFASELNARGKVLSLNTVARGETSTSVSSDHGGTSMKANFKEVKYEVDPSVNFEGTVKSLIDGTELPKDLKDKLTVWARERGESTASRDSVVKLLAEIKDMAELSKTSGAKESIATILEGLVEANALPQEVFQVRNLLRDATSKEGQGSAIGLARLVAAKKKIENALLNQALAKLGVNPMGKSTYQKKQILKARNLAAFEALYGPEGKGGGMIGEKLAEWLTLGEEGRAMLSGSVDPNTGKAVHTEAREKEFFDAWVKAADLSELKGTHSELAGKLERFKKENEELTKELCSGNCASFLGMKCKG